MIATRYEDLTVNQFQKINTLKGKKDDVFKRAELYSIISGLPLDQVDLLSPKDVYAATNFLSVPIHAMPLKKTYGRFKPILKITDITTAQHKDFNTLLTQVNGDWVKVLPELLAIMNKELTFKGYAYIQDNHFKNVEIFKKAKLRDVVGVVFFYSNYLSSLKKTIKDSLEKSQKEINEVMMMITEDSEFQTFLNNGGGNTQ